MKCNFETLVEYVAGIVDEARNKAIEEHVKTCPACTQQLAELRRTVTMLESVPRVEGRPMNMERLHSAIGSWEQSHGQFTPVWKQRRSRWRWAVALTAAACLAVLCLHYGAAVRVGRFEIAFGGPRISSAQDRHFREIARDEMTTQVTQKLDEVSRYVNKLDERYRQDLASLRSNITEQRALDRDEVEHNIRLVATRMTQALGGW